MVSTTKKAVFVKNEIYLEEIEFITKEEVSIVGIIETERGLERAQYVLDKRKFHFLLKNAGIVGREIIQIITDKFNLPHEVPVIINLATVFGKPIYIGNCALRLTRSYYQDSYTGQWKVDYSTNLFFIEEVKLMTKPLPKNKA
jgi:hypothetical protein